MKQFKHKTLLARASMMLLAMLCFLGGARAQKALPYSYGFENNNLTAEGWTAQISSSNSGINNAAAHEGSYGFRFNYSENPGYLVSPLLDGGTNPIDVSFFYKEYSSNYGNENFQVGYTTNANVTDPSEFTYGAIIEASTSWQQYTETLPAGTVRMAIKYLYVDAFYLYLDDFTFEASNSCAKPTNLNVTTDGQTATVTWDGTATNNFIVTVNGGTPVTGQTSPYTFNVAMSTTYEVVVKADCGAGSTSNPESISFTTPDCVGGHIITYALSDSYGDGWNGNAINIVDECGDIIETLTIDNGTSNNGTLSLCGDYYQFTWTIGSYASETSFTLLDNGVAIYSDQPGGSLTDGQALYTIGTNTKIPKPTDLTAGTPGYDNVDLSWTENGEATAWEICINGDESNLVPANTNENFNLTGLLPDNSYSIQVRAVSRNNISCWSAPVTFTTAESCPKPTNLAETNITYTTADLSWMGTSDSYVVQYGTWTQAGTDQIATATLEPYTFDLSGFSGMGTVAIRHYNVTDMFYLNVDDIVVKNANGETVYSQDFESGSIPSNMSNIDLDGDGYMWTMGTNGISGQSNITVNGHYGLFSASWYGGSALNPDNWLVISDVQLGGSITFKTVGQDPSVPYENFAVYVIADNQFTDAYSGTDTSCQLEGLTEGTPYAWRVKGVKGNESSKWVSSIFKTKDNLLVFANDGDWDDLDNWTDADGNAATALPTANNKVRIDADATITNGVATAKNVTLNGGSIEIEEGGQLKQGGTVKVTMHKGITGYGTGNGQYYIIATPHSASYLEENDLFPYVLNLYDGNNDLYAFDSTVELEWINYDNNSDHSEFHTGQNYGLFNKKGYLYANAENKDLKYIGTVSSSLDNTLTESYTYIATSTDPFNGWKLIGNPFTCNGYVSYSGDATFYKMNAAGDGYEAYENGVELAPGEGAFIKVAASGTITFSSEAPEGFSSILTTGAELLPILMSHGETDNQDANLSAAITFAKEGYATYYNGVYDVVLPAGMKAHAVSAGGTSLTYADVADGDKDGNVIPAGTAVLLQVEATGSEQTLPVYLITPSADPYAGTNFLFGSDEETETTGGAKYYKLTYSNSNDNFGWYWGAANGGAFTSPAHKAWLALPASAPSFLGLPDWEDTTGIIPVGVNPEDGEWYTLQGLKIGKKPTTKGVYIHNGRKVLIP